MSEETELNISTRTKINTLIDDMQHRLNKRAGYNLNNQNKGNIDLNIFKTFGIQEIAKEQEALNTKNFRKYNSQRKEHNYKKNTNTNNKLSNPPKFNNYTEEHNNINMPQPIIPILPNMGSNYPVNEEYLRNLIKDEFSNLISPYQKEIMCNSNLMETKLNEIEKKFKIIINAQNMGNLNDNAKIISAYLCSNFSGDSISNIEKLKIEYNTLFNEYQKKIDSLNNQITTQKVSNDSNFTNIFKKLDKFDKKINNKEIKIYVEKNIFDQVIDDIHERQNKILNDNENNIKNLNSQIDNINKTINQFKLDKNNDMNKINGLINNINSLKTDLGTITEDMSQIKYNITPDLINKMKSIDFNSLKQQVSPYEFKSLKDNMNIYETNFNSIKTMAENSDKNIYDIKKLLNNIEQSQSLTNKNIESLQPLLNENVLDKIKTINNKLEELSKAKTNNINDNNNPLDNNNNDNKKNINTEEKKEEEQLFIGGSRRQQRATKTVNNNSNKNNSSSLDEKTLNLIKQLEKINLNELEKINFNNILSQINDLSNKINEQNKAISEINEKLKNLKSNNNNTLDKNTYRKPELNEDFKTNTFEINDPYFRSTKTNNKDTKMFNEKDNDFLYKKEEKDIFKEDEYKDFDKDFNDDKNIFKEKEKKTGMVNIDDKNNKNNLLSDNKFGNDMLNKKNTKNDFGSFDKYSGINILDQIMGTGVGGGSRRNNGFDKKNTTGTGAGTFITGSLSGNSNNNYKFNDKPPSIFNDDDKNKIKNNEIKDKKDNKFEKKEKEKEKEKENKEDDYDDFNDDFDDFDDIN